MHIFPMLMGRSLVSFTLGGVQANPHSSLRYDVANRDAADVKHQLRCVTWLGASSTVPAPLIPALRLYVQGTNIDLLALNWVKVMGEAETEISLGSGILYPTIWMLC
ncbi:hypothetical protein GGS24DRAFT_209916 [Hypoxylon argillaceum]|nr:hypothetical protein GGS24DRAFT_209916 [Hypoxylon argillaceum]